MLDPCGASVVNGSLQCELYGRGRGEHGRRGYGAGKVLESAVSPVLVGGRATGEKELICQGVDGIGSGCKYCDMVKGDVCLCYQGVVT